ncbi:hypothetical protein ASPCAL02891 [Aspergillus calidoustus]|uniref:Uncharacterized protein n=1 Tax=Aspergillus calidoustus TaxID=454130 RepID=A0A0U5GPZ6_ASPCI|nr:hypothetical protein ASPCAL02891 [Aspergillus calidoustus]
MLVLTSRAQYGQVFSPTRYIHSAQNIFRAHLEFALQLGLRSTLRAPSRCGSAASRGILSRLKLHLVPKRQVEQWTSAVVETFTTYRVHAHPRGTISPGDGTLLPERLNQTVSIFNIQIFRRT